MDSATTTLLCVETMEAWATAIRRIAFPGDKPRSCSPDRRKLTRSVADQS